MTGVLFGIPENYLVHFYLLMGFPNICCLSDSFLLHLPFFVVVVVVVDPLPICYEIPLPIANILHCQSLSNACITSLCIGLWNRDESFSHPKSCVSGRITIRCKEWKNIFHWLKQSRSFFSQTSIMSQSRICDNLMHLKVEPLLIFC